MRSLLFCSCLLFTQISLGATLFYNGHIFSGEESRFDLSWLVVDEGRVLEVGSTETIPARWQELRDKVDLKKRYLVPGFIDAQVYFIEGGWALLESKPVIRPFEQKIELTPHQVSSAILLAQRRALSLGITTIRDNTFDPAWATEYRRLATTGLLKMRVALQSYGKIQETKFLMKSVRHPQSGDRLFYFGPKYFLEDSSFSEEDLRRIMIFSDRYGLGFHLTQDDQLKRLANVKKSISIPTAKKPLPDVIESCEKCSVGEIKRAFEQGFRVVLSTHPMATHVGTDEEKKLGLRTPSLLEVIDSGVEPALASGWPRGDSRDLLSPMRNVALSIHNQNLSEDQKGHVLRAITTNAAGAVGRGDDLGKIKVGYRADFVLLDRSPLLLSKSESAQPRVLVTYIDGEKVYDASENSTPLDPPSENRDRGWPMGRAMSPIVGYDQTVGFIGGAALFFYPYHIPGWQGEFQTYYLPSQGRVKVITEWSRRKFTDSLSPFIRYTFRNTRSRYFGVGDSTSSETLFMTDPTAHLADLGVTVHWTENLNAIIEAQTHQVQEVEESQILEFAKEAEGRVSGDYLGVRASLEWNTRESQFSTRFGSRAVLWIEHWFRQAGESLSRQRGGFQVQHFTPLVAPNLVLASRFEVGGSQGEVAYETNFSLGGNRELRGYYGNRFRGHHYWLGSEELRFPLWSIFSGVCFVDFGSIWLNDEKSNGIRSSGGMGLRIGLPPDGLIKVRLDFGFAPDQSGLFLAFNEAF